MWWKEVTDAVTFYLAKDTISIKISEKSAKTVDPHYIMLSSKYFFSTANSRFMIKY